MRVKRGLPPLFSLTVLSACPLEASHILVTRLSFEPRPRKTSRGDKIRPNNILHCLVAPPRTHRPDSRLPGGCGFVGEKVIAYYFLTRAQERVYLIWLISAQTFGLIQGLMIRKVQNHIFLNIFKSIIILRLVLNSSVKMHNNNLKKMKWRLWLFDTDLQLICDAQQKINVKKQPSSSLIVIFFYDYFDVYLLMNVKTTCPSHLLLLMLATHLKILSKILVPMTTSSVLHICFSS